MPPRTGQLARAKIVNVDTNETLMCMFNPDTYTFTKTNTWKAIDTKADLPVVEFQGGQVGKLTLDLWFDSNEKHASSTLNAGDDIRNVTSKLWKMMAVSDSRKNEKTQRGSPPLVRFEWGSLWSFKAVIESITETFTLFRSDGTPVRSQVKITMQQVDDGSFPAQNPTSGGTPGQHLRTVVEGETLAGIAYDAYGDATVWRHIAETNGITDPRRLRPGQVLLITPLPPQ
jgi:hypothetical protein